jgi:hypothetical protein
MQGFSLSVGSIIIGRHKLFLIAGGILFYFAAHFIIKTPNNLHNLTKILNVVALSLVLISLISISIEKYSSWRVSRGKGEMITDKTDKLTLGKTTRLPDIYYIVLDAYGRADILSEVYGYNNGEFINYLKQKGFYVANKSKSNYQSTFLSIASTLNMSYLDLSDGYKKDNFSDNRVFALMKQYGYTTVFISSLDADIRMVKADFNLRFGWLNYFNYQLINLTPVPELLSNLHLPWGSYSLHRKSINYTFDTTEDMAEWASPIFVYTHIIAPHPPFVFGPNGENVQPNRRYNSTGDEGNIFFTNGGTRDEYIKGYRDEIEYLNRRLMRLINHILSRKNNSPIIILQGDHGPRAMAYLWDPDRTYLKEAYSILNAYYLPGNGNKLLYESITPVNTFRLVFNLYFGGSYDLLKDRSYFYDYLVTSTLVDVTIKADNGKYSQ